MVQTFEQSAVIRRADSTRSARIETYFSRHDNGWYSEVISSQTGQTLHTTELFPTREESTAAAVRWCDPTQKE